MPDLIPRREFLKIASAACVGVSAFSKGWTLPKELVQNVGHAGVWAPVFFNAHQNEATMLLADLIIPETDTPGAKQANVHRYIDLFLSVKSVADQQQFVDGLAWLDKCAEKNYNREFTKCSLTEQSAILDRIAGSDAKRDPENAFFQMAKGLVSAIYCSTPEGQQELNKFGPPPVNFGCESERTSMPAYSEIGSDC